MSEANARSLPYEYIVVGSGAGGGTLAARLAERGRSVLLLEAGSDTTYSLDVRLPEDYQVPAFHAFASENPAMKWDFFVRHYDDEERQKKDSKYASQQGGVLYPRAGTLGGCTAHNAMILVYPLNADWEHIEQLTGDRSWSAANMRQYFGRMENCRHRWLKRFIATLTGWNPSRHGFGGWLTTEMAMPMDALGNRYLKTVLEECAVDASAEIGERLKRLRWFFKTRGDPNDWRLVRANAFGLRLLPLTTQNHARVGSRERVRQVANEFPEKLHIECDALVTRVLFEKNRAIGVEYLKGERLYRAHANPSDDAGEKRQAHAGREVILCGGAFNTPQLLMLFGIGAAQELKAHGIEPRVELPGVGRNLQDRYEISVVYRMNQDWHMLAGAKFSKDDDPYRLWNKTPRDGVYTTNGGVLAIIKRSRQDRIPDLFCMGLVGKFKGYFPGYSKLIADHHNYLSWIVLKARTLNDAGRVTLQSPDPREPPKISFRYFDEGSDTQGKDLEAVVEG